MEKFLAAVHIVLAVFAIGPLAHAATTAARGIRTANAPVVAAAARTVNLYGYLSIAVGIVGMSLVQPKPAFHDRHFSDTWIWLSAVLWLVAVLLIFTFLLPNLRGAATALQNGASAASLTGRVAAGGGLLALIYLVIVVLMVYKPGA